MAGKQRISWRRALLWSAVAVYGPGDGVLGYVFACVSCSHCKVASMHMLPLGPGVVLFHLAMQISGSQILRGLPDSVTFVLGGVISAILVISLAWLAKHGWWWLISSCLLAAAASLIASLGLLAAIRS
jgi:hypothetical protein